MNTFDKKNEKRVQAPDRPAGTLNCYNGFIQMLFRG